MSAQDIDGAKDEILAVKIRTNLQIHRTKKSMMFISKNEKNNIIAASEESNSTLQSLFIWGKESQWVSDWSSKMNQKYKDNYLWRYMPGFMIYGVWDTFYHEYSYL